jgi:amino acid transporter
LLVTTVVGAALLLLSNVAADIYTLLVNLTAGSFFLAFFFPLLGALVVQLRGQWVPGAFGLGKARLPITIVAVLWTGAEFVNIAWPRAVYPHAYLNWSVWLGTGILAVVGTLVFASIRGSFAPHAALSADGATPAELPASGL